MRVPAIRVALRSLRKTPGFTATALLTLALGIGLSTAVFTVADAVLLRPLPVRDQSRLLVLYGEDPSRGYADYPLGLEDGREFARRSTALDGVAFFGYEGAVPVPVVQGDRITRLRRAMVSGDFFQVLGARPVLGRALRASDDVAGAAPVAVLSYTAWQRRFDGDPGVLGRNLQVYGIADYTIVGVMPQGLDYPSGADLWAPIMASFRSGADSHLEYVAVNLIGRLKPGATPAAARAELTAFFRRPEASPSQRKARGVVHALPEIVLGDVRPALFAFAAAAALLLLITCINVANLLLVRGLARVREVAVRAAVGAGRGRIVGQLLTENGLLAMAGGVLGVGVAAAAVRAFIAFAPPGIPRLDEVRLNGAMLAGAIAITTVATLLFALAPAVITSRVELQQVLRSDGRQSTSRRSRLAAEALVAGQVALALMVLSAAGLIGRSLVELERARLSLQPAHLLIGELALRFDRYDDTAKQTALLDLLDARLRATPGVLGVSPVVAVPFSGTAGWDGRPSKEGQSREEAASNPILNMDLVAPDYFATMGVPVLRGRGFTAADREDAPRVIVISSSAAREYFPGQNPIGQRLQMGTGSAPEFTVVGVVPDTRYRDLREARASIYFPLHQSIFPYTPTALAIRTGGPPAALVPTIRRVIANAAPGVELADVAPFDTYLQGPLAQPRLNALLLLIFAAAAVTLAAVGLFGVMMTMVRQRGRELGIRVALGATARDLRRLVMRRGLAITAVGLAVGLLGALLADRLLAALLYGVAPGDAATMAGVVGVLLAIAATATVMPARAGARADGVGVLRGEGT